MYLWASQGSRQKQEQQPETFYHIQDSTQLWWNLCCHQPIPKYQAPTHRQTQCYCCYHDTIQFCTSKQVVEHHWRLWPKYSEHQISMPMTPRTHAPSERTLRTPHTPPPLHPLWAHRYIFLLIIIIDTCYFLLLLAFFIGEWIKSIIFLFFSFTISNNNILNILY